MNQNATSQHSSNMQSTLKRPSSAVSDPSICRPKMCRSSRRSTFPATLFNTKIASRPLYWFLPNGGNNNLASFLEEERSHSLEKDNNSLYFSDDDSIATEITDCDYDDDDWTTNLAVGDDEEEDLRGLSFVQ